ncbi:hypothetical protein PT974_09259 [Cladobotryum mycophilum]|uniref:Uncharacterized protein n=1 Tax=Cladobotryum mycophilum TaxID=491253 RepID=A0ABR0SFP8_9HYPO
MPSRVTNVVASTRFELPALDLNFGSITDGTNIPPPERSPVPKVPTPPETPSSKNEDDTKTEAAGGVEDCSSPTNGKLAGLKRPADDTPLALPALPGPAVFAASSGSASISNLSRPDSRSGASVMDERKSKRASGWFRRLRSGDPQSKRRSSLFGFDEAPVMPKKPATPPPPMIPELADLEKDEGSLGNDLFNHIK